MNENDPFGLHASPEEARRHLAAGMMNDLDRPGVRGRDSAPKRQPTLEEEVEEVAKEMSDAYVTRGPVFWEPTGRMLSEWDRRLRFALSRHYADLQSEWVSKAMSGGMLPTPVVGRCFFRHDWSRWDADMRSEKAKAEATPDIQARACRRCGYRQEEKL